MDKAREASNSAIEIWLPVIGYEDRYVVSNIGRVSSKKSILKPYSVKGYPKVGFWNKDKKRMDIRHVHSLVLTAFDGPKKAGQVCRHLDGDPGNNALHNLCWGTERENHLDAKRHGTYKPPPRLVQAGELNHAVKLTLDQVRYIRQTKESAKALAARLGVTQWTIFDIRKGRSWSEVFKRCVELEAEGTGV